MSARAERRAVAAPGRRAAFVAGTVLATAALLAVVHLGARDRARGMAGVRASEASLPGEFPLAAPTTDGCVAADAQGTLRTVVHGQVTATRALNTPLTAVAADPSTGRVYAADIERRLWVLDAGLVVQRHIDLPGQAFAMAPLAGGALALCYGLNGYGPDYTVAILEDPVAGALPAGYGTGFATRLLASDGGRAYYATYHARVGAVSPDGQPLWERVLDQRPISLAASAQGRIAVGDFSGGLTVLDTDGVVLRTTPLSRFGLVHVAFSPDASRIVAADERGIIFVLTSDGRPVVTVPPSRANHRVAAFLPASAGASAPAPSELLAVSYLGDTESLHLGSVPGGLTASLTPVTTVALDVAVLFLAALLLAATGRRTGPAMRQGLRRVVDCRTAYLLIAPTFVLLLVFSYYPVVTALLYSLTTFSLSSPLEFVGLQNFRTLRSDPYVWTGVKNMLILLVSGMVKTLTVPLLTAELVFWLAGERLRRTLRTLFVFPSVVPGLVGVLLWKMIYDPQAGLFNRALEAAGLENWSHAWLADEKLAIWAIVFAGFPWVNVLAFLIFLGGLINIERSIYDAAEIDGVSIWSRFRCVDLPLIAPQVRLLVILVFIGAVQDFTSVLIFTGGGPGSATYVPALQMFMQTAEGANLGYASAIGTMLFAVVLAVTLVFTRAFKGQES